METIMTKTTEPLKEASLQLWRSWSHGGAYRLGWSRCRRRLSGASDHAHGESVFIS
jgi:hypothetical protein